VVIPTGFVHGHPGGQHCAREALMNDRHRKICFGGCIATLLLSSSANAQTVLGEASNARPVVRSRNNQFPDYDQPTTRYVTTGENLRRTRQFSLGNQMSRESLGFSAR